MRKCNLLLITLTYILLPVQTSADLDWYSPKESNDPEFAGQLRSEQLNATFSEVNITLHQMYAVVTAATNDLETYIHKGLEDLRLAVTKGMKFSELWSGYSATEVIIYNWAQSLLVNMLERTQGIVRGTLDATTKLYLSPKLYCAQPSDLERLQSSVAQLKDCFVEQKAREAVAKGEAEGLADIVLDQLKHCWVDVTNCTHTKLGNIPNLISTLHRFREGFKNVGNTWEKTPLMDIMLCVSEKVPKTHIALGAIRKRIADCE